MLSTSQIAGFLCLQNKFIKQPHFLHVDINSQKLKCFSWAWSNMGVANLSLDSKIDCLKIEQME